VFLAEDPPTGQSDPASCNFLNQDYTEVAGAEGFHPSSIGLHGQNDDNVMPTLAGLSNAQGGYGQGIGPFTLIHIINPKPTANLSLTWVKGNHTYKFGGDMVIDGFINENRTYAEPWITFAATETTNPAGRCHPERSCQAFCGSEPLHTASERPFRSWLIWSAWLSWRRIPAAP
jgi:hypothetical protein